MASLAPLARTMAKATTGRPSRRAKRRCSAAPSDHRRDVRQPDAAVARERNRRVADFLNGARARQRADGLFLPRDLAAPAADVDVGGAQLPADLAGGDAERKHPVGIELHLDLAIHAADALHGADAAHALQRAGRNVVHEP